MSATHNPLKSFARAAIVVAALGATAIVAAPAQAEGTAQFGFSFQSPDGSSFSFGNGGFNGRHFQQRQQRRSCLADWQAANVASARGFSHVKVKSTSRNTVKLTGWFRGQAYTMSVGRCSGKVTNIAKIGRRGNWGNQGQGNRHGWSNSHGGGHRGWNR